MIINMKIIGTIKNICIIILSILVIVFGVWIGRIYYHQPKLVAVWQDCVPDSESAIRIAQVVYKAYYGIEFEANDFKCMGDDTGWQVHLITFDEPEDQLIGCDRAGIIINRKDGTIDLAYPTTEVDEFYKYKTTQGNN